MDAGSTGEGRGQAEGSAPRCAPLSDLKSEPKKMISIGCVSYSPRLHLKLV